MVRRNWREGRLTTHDSAAGSRHREGGKPTASDLAYAAIRDLILKTELKPGQVLYLRPSTVRGGAECAVDGEAPRC